MVEIPEEYADVHDMKVEEMVQEIVSLREALAERRRTIADQARVIEQLRSAARSYYRAADDYVPPPENDYDR